MIYDKGFKTKNDKGFDPHCQLSVNMTRSMHVRVRNHAARRGMSMSDWVREQIEKGLDEVDEGEEVDDEDDDRPSPKQLLSRILRIPWHCERWV